MDEESENFCLKWDEFEQNIIGAFKDLRKEKDFYDVTLVCGEKQVQAHRVVLAACSPTFRQMIRHSPHHHPVLYLRGIRAMDLVAMLDFMYHGEVMIATEELETFLATAHDLSVRGLTQAGDDRGTENDREPEDNNNREPVNPDEALNDDVENLIRTLESGEPPEKVRKLNVKKEPGVRTLPASITKIRMKQEISSIISIPNPPTPTLNSVFMELEAAEEPPPQQNLEYPPVLQPNLECPPVLQPNLVIFPTQTLNVEHPQVSSQSHHSMERDPMAQAPSSQTPGLNISTVTEQTSSDNNHDSEEVDYKEDDKNNQGSGFNISTDQTPSPAISTRAAAGPTINFKNCRVLLPLDSGPMAKINFETVKSVMATTRNRQKRVSQPTSHQS